MSDVFIDFKYGWASDGGVAVYYTYLNWIKTIFSRFYEFTIYNIQSIEDTLNTEIAI